LPVDPSFCSLEVFLKDAGSPHKPIEMARKELPYYLDVKSSKSWIRGLPSHQDKMQQANIGASSNIRRGAKHHSPAATPSPLPHLNWWRDHLQRGSNFKYDENR